MNAIPTKVVAQGRLVIPRDLRDALGIPEGGPVKLSVRDGVLTVETTLATVRRLQAMVRSWQTRPGYVPYTTDDFLSDRHAEAQREAAKLDAQAAGRDPGNPGP